MIEVKLNYKLDFIYSWIICLAFNTLKSFLTSKLEFIFPVQ